jgi:hypothetical protein
LIEDEQTPESQNVVFRYGRVKVDTGYAHIGAFKLTRINASAAAGANGVAVAGSDSAPQGVGRGDAWGYHVGDIVRLTLNSGALHVTTVTLVLHDYPTPNYDFIGFADVTPSPASVGKFLYKGNILRGTPQGVFEHESAAGTTELVLVTQDSFYKYLPAIDEWQYVPTEVSTTLGANENGTSTVLNVLDTTGFVVGRYIGLEMDNTTQHQAKITAIAGVAPGTITIDTQVPGAAGDVMATAGNTVVQAVVLTGNDDNQVVFTGVPSNEWTAFTNNVNVPYKYDGSTVEIIPNLPAGGNIVCRAMCMHNEGFLVLGGLIEGGTEAPYKVIWCDAGDPTNWSTGLASSKLLLDARDAVIAMKPLAGEVVIYRTRSPIIMKYLGTASYTFEWIPRASGESSSTQGFGPVSSNSVFALADRHVIIDRAGVLVYRGGLSVEDISSEIYDTVFSDTGLMDGDKLHRSFVYHSDRPGELFCMYTDGQHDFPNRAAVLDFRNGTWRLRKFYNEMTAAGLRADSTGVRIIDLEGTIAEQAWVIGGGAAQGQMGTMILAGADGDVYEYDYFTPTDGFQAIDWWVDTKLLEYGDRSFRLGMSEVEYKGPDADLYLSQDRNSYSILRALASVNKLTAYRTMKQSVQRAIQYRIQGSGPGAEIGAVRYRYKEESRWNV